MNNSPLTSEEFAERKYELPEGGRWTELRDGSVYRLSPPTDLHGDIVRNFSFALGAYAQQGNRGYPAFDLGVVVQRNPDSVFVPPIVYFIESQGFLEFDEVLSARTPEIVIEIASSNDRRVGLQERILQYLKAGVVLVWAIDSLELQVHECTKDAHQILKQTDAINGRKLLDGFNIPVQELFQEPKWETQPRRKSNGKPASSDLP